MESFLQDIRFSLRTLRKNPGFAAVAVLSLALGIGANTAIYSIYSSVFLKDLPVEDVDTLVEFYTHDPEEDFMEHSVSSYPDFISYREQSGDVFEDMIIYNVAFVVHDTGEESNYLFGEEVSANFFDMLGVGTVLGRTFNEETEGIIGAPPTVVIGHSFWQTHFGGDPDVIGRSIILSGLDFTIIGVLPPEFQGMFPIQADVWYPMTLIPQLRPGDNTLESRGSHSLWIKARLKEGVTVEQAEAACQVIAARLAEEYPETNEGLTPLLVASKEVSLHPELDGIIKGFTVLLDDRALGFDVSAFAMIKLHSQAEVDLIAFEEWAAASPVVRDCHMLSGEIDFVLRCVAPDLTLFQDFIIRELTAAPNVESVKTALVIRTSKQAPGVPTELMSDKVDAEGRAD